MKPVNRHRQEWWFFATMYLHIFIMTVLAVAHCRSNNPLAGPFQVVFKTGGKCPKKDGDKELLHFEDRIVEVSKDYSYLLVNATFDIPLSDEIKGTIKMSRLTTEGWKENFFVGNVGGVCTAARVYLPSMYNDVSRQLKQKNCPIPAGIYSNIKIDLSNMTVAGLRSLMYSEYHVRFYAKKDGETVRCLEIFLNVTRKHSG